MREDATMIFFSLNNFLILPPQVSKPAWHLSKHTQPLEILKFFSTFVAGGRKHLRSVTWMLPEVNRVWGPKEQAEWKQVVNTCAEELSIESLAFTIDLSYQARRRRSLGPYYADDRTLPISSLEEYE
jgi:hypothetical protein